MSDQKFDPDSSQIYDEDEEDLPDLNPEPDNEPDDSAPYVAGEAQDREGTERPAVDKHPED
jgi:hypothetical protein